jgi:ribonuclease J
VKNMQACIHRGSKQIGGNCVEVESQGQRLLIDFGLPLDAEENHGKYVPSIGGLDGGDPSLWRMVRGLIEKTI